VKKQLLGLALAATWMGSGAVWAQAPATPAAPAPTTIAPAPPEIPVAPMPAKRAAQVQGQVTAVDLTKRTVTVTERRGGTIATVTLSPDAKVVMTHPASISDIKTGDVVEVYASSLTSGATTVTADRIVIVLPGVPHGKPGPNAGYHPRYVQGTVATTGPALTMTTPGGVTVTVTPAAGAPVTKLVEGSLTDIAVGTNIQARTKGDAASPTATEVRIMPAGGARRAGGRRRRNAPVDAGAPVTTTPAVPETPATPAAPPPAAP
jgi:hypothetical protein